MRINKLLAMYGVASRRSIDRWIEEGAIKINGIVATLGQDATESDLILVKGKKVEFPKTLKKVYYMLNKPEGVMCTLKDSRNRRLVVDFIESKERIYPIGRLDYMTEGLILLTNDGEVVNKLLHPSKQVWKRYYCQVNTSVQDSHIKAWRGGVMLDDGMTLPAKIERDIKNKNAIYIEIAEGRNRQIRRMMGYFNYEVKYLQRVRIGEIRLDNRLLVGKYRSLTSTEIAYLESL